MADLRTQAAAEGGSEADEAGPWPRRLIWREGGGPLRVSVAGLQKPPGAPGSGEDLLVVPPHLRTCADRLHGGPSQGAAARAKSAALDAAVERLLAHTGAEAAAAGDAAAAAAAGHALAAAAGGGPGGTAAWVAEMLEAQRPSINAAAQRGVPVRVRLPGALVKQSHRAAHHANEHACVQVPSRCVHV